MKKIMTLTTQNGDFPVPYLNQRVWYPHPFGWSDRILWASPALHFSTGLHRVAVAAQLTSKSPKVRFNASGLNAKCLLVNTVFGFGEIPVLFSDEMLIRWFVDDKENPWSSEFILHDMGSHNDGTPIPTVPTVPTVTFATLSLRRTVWIIPWHAFDS